MRSICRVDVYAKERLGLFLMFRSTKLFFFQWSKTSYLITSAGPVSESCLNEVKMFRNYRPLDCEGPLTSERPKIGRKAIPAIAWNILRTSLAFSAKMLNLTFLSTLPPAFNQLLVALSHKFVA